MDTVFMGHIVGSCSRISEEDGKRCASIYFHDTESNACSKLSHYNKTYSLVLSDDVIKTNDELLRLRDEVKEWDDECTAWRARYAKANNELFQKGLAYNTLEGAYKNEKIAGEILLKDRDALKEKVEKLEAELMEIKTARTLREAYITGVEKGCESLREERDRWKRRCNSVMTDISNTLSADGIELTVEDVLGDVEWKVGFDIPELNEAKKKVEDLEKKLAASKSNETFWRGRKEEYEGYHHYWLNTFDRAVKQAAEKGIHIGVRGNDDECNAGIVTLDDMKAEELEKQIVQMEDANKKLNQKIGAADNALEYWNNTYNDIVIAGKKVGVKIDIKGKKPDDNAGFVYVTNEKAEDLEKKIKRLEDDNSIKAEAVIAAKDRGDYWLREHDVKSRMYHELEEKHDAKWTTMCDALKAKGVEVIYMGEEDGKPIVDVKIPEIDKLKKELETLKSRTLDNVEIRLSCGDIVWTYCDGSVHVSSGISGMISADEISTGTLPKCSSCAHYVSGSRMADIWCHRPSSKEGPGTVRRLSTEEAESPACSDYKARKE